MQQFIPFEDDWDALELLRPEALLPYRADLSCVFRGDKPASPAIAAPMPINGASLIDTAARPDILITGSRQAA